MKKYRLFFCCIRRKRSQYIKYFFLLTLAILIVYSALQTALMSLFPQIVSRSILVIITFALHLLFLATSVVFYLLFLFNRARYDLRKFKTRPFAFSLILCFGVGVILFGIIIGDFVIKILEIDSYSGYYSQRDVVTSE